MTRIRGARKKPPIGSWPLQDAKARFSELVRRAKAEGPQLVTVHGHEEVVVLAAAEFRRLVTRDTSEYEVAKVAVHDPWG